MLWPDPPEVHPSLDAALLELGELLLEGIAEQPQNSGVAAASSASITDIAKPTWMSKADVVLVANRVRDPGDVARTRRLPWRSPSWQTCWKRVG